MRSAALNLLLALASAVACAALMVGAYEILQSRDYDRWRAQFRIDGDGPTGMTMASVDPVLMWEYRPNRSFAHPKFGAVTKTNAFGFRQPDGVGTTKTGDTLRIAFIGDSVTLGREVAFEKTFPEIVRASAATSGSPRPVEALNFAIDGYGAPQIARLLERTVLRFSPDLVVYTLCLNDFDFDDASGDKIRFFRKPASFFLEDMRKLLRRTVADEYHTYHFRRNATVVFKEIAGMRDAARAAGAGFVVFVVPVFWIERIGLTGATSSGPLESFGDYPLRELHQEVVAGLTRDGVRAIDLLPDFAASKLRPVHVSVDVWHLSERGHELVGRSIFDRLFGKR